MNIVYYSYDHVLNPFCGGGGAYRDRMIHLQLAHKHTVRFFCGKFKGARNHSEDGIDFVYLGWGSNYLISRMSFALYATLHSLFITADVIVIGFSVFSPVMTFLFRRKKCVIELFHLTKTAPFRKYSIFGLFPYCAEKIALAGGSYFICINKALAETIKQSYPGKNVCTVYTGFDHRLLSKDIVDDGYILSMGRIDIHMKGIDLLIDAFEIISASFPRHSLVIAGRGSPHDVTWLKKRIEGSPVREKIVFKENVSDNEKILLFHHATFVCMPSRFEGWCIAAIEAAASSKATLGTRIVGLGESIRHDETGLLVAPEDKDELADKIRLLLSDHTLRKRLGTNGYSWAQHFTWEKIAEAQEQFYLSIVGRKTGG
jgi:glycosyltransferase involved in cell wall biosynthesis